MAEVIIPRRYIVVDGRRHSSISVDELSRLYNDGWGLRRLARHFKMSRGAVDKKLRRSGLKEIGRGATKKLPGDRGRCKQCREYLSKGQYSFCSSSCCAKFYHAKRCASLAGPTRYSRKPCVLCWTEHTNAFYCSRSCRDAAVNSVNPGDRQKLIRRPRVPKEPRSCRVCSNEHDNKLYCSPACRIKGIRARLTEEERKERHRLKNLLGVRRYQARRAGQTPEDVDKWRIKEIYENCPPGHEVDHIIPIAKGGLHHPDNMQYLPLSANRRKGSKMPHEWTLSSEAERPALNR